MKIKNHLIQVYYLRSIPVFQQNLLSAFGCWKLQPIALSLFTIKILKKTRPTINNPNTDAYRISNGFNVYFINDTFVNIENLTQENTTSNNIILALDEAQIWKTNKYSNNCLEDSNCQPLKNFEQSSLLKTKGHLSTTVDYTTETETNRHVTLSITVK